MFSITPSFFFYSPVFLLLFFIGQMGPMVFAMPSNATNDMGPNTNLTSRLDDQNRGLLEKAMKLVEEVAAEWNASHHLSNETMGKLKELAVEIFDAMDEDKDGNVTREEMFRYALEIALPFYVEWGIKHGNLTSAQQEQVYADLNARMPGIKDTVEKAIDKTIEKGDKNGDGQLSKAEVEMMADEMGANPGQTLEPHAHLMSMLA